MTKTTPYQKALFGLQQKFNSFDKETVELHEVAWREFLYSSVGSMGGDRKHATEMLLLKRIISLAPQGGVIIHVKELKATL